MAGRMMSAPRNRSALKVDSPRDDDGFWTARRFHGSRRAGARMGGRLWRGIIRSKESRAWRADAIRTGAQDD